MTHLLPGLIAVLGLIGAASVAARRLGLPPPVLLAIAGIAWSLLPALSPLEIAPHVVLAVFLPPLLYAEAWHASWHDFRRWLRPILSLAIGLVAFTILCVGVVAKLLMPELPWAVCFLIGAILSPTDTVAVHSVLSRLRVPRRVTAILGGESLINDATGLLGVQLAMTVVLTGVFEAGAIATHFVRIAGLGVASGVAVGLLAVAAQRSLARNGGAVRLLAVRAVPGLRGGRGGSAPRASWPSSWRASSPPGASTSSRPRAASISTSPGTCWRSC